MLYVRGMAIDIPHTTESMVNPAYYGSCTVPEFNVLQYNIELCMPLSYAAKVLNIYRILLDVAFYVLLWWNKCALMLA